MRSQILLAATLAASPALACPDGYYSISVPFFPSICIPNPKVSSPPQATVAKRGRKVYDAVSPSCVADSSDATKESAIVWTQNILLKDAAGQTYSFPNIDLLPGDYIRVTADTCSSAGKKTPQIAAAKSVTRDIVFRYVGLNPGKARSLRILAGTRAEVQALPLPLQIDPIVAEKLFPELAVGTKIYSPVNKLFLETKAVEGAGGIVGEKSSGKWEAGNFAQVNIGCVQAWVCTPGTSVLHSGSTIVVTSPNEKTTGVCNAGGGAFDSCNQCSASPPTNECKYWLETKD